MAVTLIIHIQNSDPVVGESEEIPTTTDTMVHLRNPRRMDGKDLPYIAENVLSVFWPVDRINFIEVMGEEEEKIIGFYRE